MLIIVINSYNTEYYVHKCKDLLESILHITDEFGIIVVRGGCKTPDFKMLNNYIDINITENLSDYNVYKGFKNNLDLFQDDIYKNATYVMIHDTCIITNRFVDCMRRLSEIRFQDKSQWIFAHTYGLYNMGICNYEFIINKSINFENITEMPKNEGILLEHGSNVKINGYEILSLHHNNYYTLANMIVLNKSLEESVYETDYFSINGIYNKNNIKYISYVASFGIYKFYNALNISYKMPIWGSLHDHPRSIKEYNDMKQNEFFPLIPYIYYGI
jgi:hypothetical protein